jgi:uncharacterized protein (TIGR03067 family)
MSLERIEAAGFRLADAQSAIARQNGFASWPSLGRHVEQLRALEGHWAFASLEIDGQSLPAEMLAHSRLLIDGDRFRMESPEADYEGVFNIDVDELPHHIDIDFVAGPEAGHASHGLFELEGDALRICLGLAGVSRPERFATAPGRGHALETLRRVSAERPAGVEGGTPPAKDSGEVVAAKTMASEPPAGTAAAVSGESALTPALLRLAGRWKAVELVMDGKSLPEAMLAVGERTLTGDELRVVFGGQVMVHARVIIRDEMTPIEVDYLNLSASARGATTFGIMDWQDEVARFCMARPGSPRPADFSCEHGSGRTLSRWRRG